MNKITVLNGGPHKAGKTMTLVNEVLSVISNKNISIKIHHINSKSITGCQGCFGCKKDGVCVLKDDMQEIYQDIEESECIIFATPVYIWQMTAQTKLVIDRLYAYMKQDYTSFLAPGKKVIFIATFGGGSFDQYHNYFNSTCKSLSLLGFGDYKVLLTGGLKDSSDLSSRTDVISEAQSIGEWLSITY